MLRRISGSLDYKKARNCAIPLGRPMQPVALSGCQLACKGKQPNKGKQVYPGLQVQPTNL
jgi:hypothetical protein